MMRVALSTALWLKAFTHRCGRGSSIDCFWLVMYDESRTKYVRSFLMKIARVTCCLFILLLSLVAFAFTTSAPRAHAASGTTFVDKFHGRAAVANFGGLSSDGCIDTIIEVHGFQPIQNKQPSNAFVFISKFDTCTNTSLLDASGSTDTAIFQIDERLISASLSATVPLTDNQTGNPLFNVTVNMVWTTPPDSVIQHQN